MGMPAPLRRPCAVHLAVLCLLAMARGDADFPFRAWCETGQLLDFPDVGYYSTKGPTFVNDARVAGEVQRLQLLAPVLSHPSMNMTAFMLFNPAVDDYLTYSAINASLFPPGSMHYNRSVSLSRHVTTMFKAFKEQGLSTYIATFEPTYPEGLAHDLDLSRLGPDLDTFLTLKYSELFRAIPTLDGVMVYVTDNWGDRGPAPGYVFPRNKPVWTTGRELASLAASLQEAVQHRNGKDFLLSLWDGVKTWPEFKAYCPKSLRGVVHLTYPGFNLNAGLSPTVSQGGAEVLDQLYVALDPYREKDGGWTRMLSSPARTWGGLLQAALHHNVTGVLAFANWGPTWSWPNWDTHGFLVNATAPGALPVSWTRHQDLRAVNHIRGVSPTTPFRAQELAGYTFAALAANASRDSPGIAAEWAAGFPLQLAPSDAAAVAEINEALEAAWRLYADNDVNTWQFLFNRWQPHLSVPGDWPRWGGFLAQMDSMASKVQSLLPAATGPYTLELQRAVNLTTLHLQTYAAFTAACWLDQALQQQNRTVCETQGATLSLLDSLFAAYDARFPEDATTFQVTRLDPRLAVRPDFMPRDNNRSMAAWVANVVEPRFHDECQQPAGLPSSQRLMHH